MWPENKASKQASDWPQQKVLKFYITISLLFSSNLGRSRLTSYRRYVCTSRTRCGIRIAPPRSPSFPFSRRLRWNFSWQRISSIAEQQQQQQQPDTATRNPEWTQDRQLMMSKIRTHPFPQLLGAPRIILQRTRFMTQMCSSIHFGASFFWPYTLFLHLSVIQPRSQPPFFYHASATRVARC